MRKQYSPEIKSNAKFYKGRDTWYKIIKRCYIQNCKDYKYYGARNITIDPTWLNSFEEFFKYCITLPNAFEKDYSIDRIDNNGNYEPDNLRFINHKEQCNNRRSNRLYTFRGITKNITQWAEEFNLKWEFVRDRLDLGFTIEEALTLPKGSRRDKNKLNTTKRII